jgi:hypothetical protein
VNPHFEVKAEDALAVAHGMAIDRVLEGLGEGEGEAKWRKELLEVRAGLPAAPGERSAQTG